MNNYLFGEDLRDRCARERMIAENKLALLNKHRQNILLIQRQKLTVFSIQDAINLMAFYMLKDHIEQAKETELLELYIKILIKIKSELTKGNSKLKISIEKLKEIDAKEFLEDVDKHAFKQINILSDWDDFMGALSLYVIPKYDLLQFIKALNLDNAEPILPDKKQKILSGRKVIREILSSFTEDELLAFKNIGQGQNGLKKAVFQKLTAEDFRNYFNSNKTTFKSRWDEVRNLDNL